MQRKSRHSLLFPGFDAKKIRSAYIIQNKVWPRIRRLRRDFNMAHPDILNMAEIKSLRRCDTKIRWLRISLFLFRQF